MLATINLTITATGKTDLDTCGIIMLPYCVIFIAQKGLMCEFYFKALFAKLT